MSDLIRREDVFKAIVGLTTHKTVDDIEIFCKSVAGSEGWLGGIRDALREVEYIPSAEPERKWIPFEVALPNDRQKVLCVNKHGEMMVGGYMTDYGMTFPCYFEKPIAWMPLPESYKGDR